MTTYKHNRPGVGSVGQYQMSGQPYLFNDEIDGADIVQIADFHYVTKFVTVMLGFQRTASAHWLEIILHLIMVSRILENGVAEPSMPVSTLDILLVTQ